MPLGRGAEVYTMAHDVMGKKVQSVIKSVAETCLAYLCIVWNVGAFFLYVMNFGESFVLTFVHSTRNMELFSTENRTKKTGIVHLAEICLLMSFKFANAILLMNHPHFVYPALSKF